MIKFFRNIRRRLLKENKTAKYFKYAIGEIVLVVIGILIALQINTWNENRKARGVEIATLKELRSDLEQSLNDIIADQEYFKFCEKSTQYILRHFENAEAPADSLDYHFSNMYPFSTFSINRTTFDNLRQSGNNVITNDSLRIKLSDLYTRSINLYKELEQRAVISHDENFITPMKMTEFVTYTSDKLVLKDYEGFFSNTKHQQVLNKSIFIFKNLIQYQSFVLKDIRSLIDQINQEIDYKQ